MMCQTSTVRSVQPTIEVTPGAALRVGAGTVMYERFTARFTADDNIPCDVELEISVHEGIGPRCTSLRASGREVTGTVIRAIPVAELVRAACRWATFLEDGLTPLPVAEQLHSEGRRLAADADRALAQRGSREITDEFLAEVAAVYRDAVDRGEPPIEVLHTRFHRSKSAASKWVVEARRRRILGPTEQRKAGEITTKKAAKRAAATKKKGSR